MNRTAELGQYISHQLGLANQALKLAETDLTTGVSAARTALRSARAVMRLLESADKRLRELNDELGVAASRLGPIRDGYVKRVVPPPLSPSILTEISTSGADVQTARAELVELLDGLRVSNTEIVFAAGRTYRQARRRFLRALPEEDDELFDVDALNKCRKATQRVHLQSEALLSGKQSKRSDRFAKLGQSIWDHRDARVLGLADAVQLAQLENEITRLGLDLFKGKPAAHREWLSGKLEEN
jgi:hypothetical protein